jgi:hypothetical protein
MAGRLTISSTLALVLLGTSPGWAMSTVTLSTKSDAARFTEPANKPQKRMSGTAEAVGSYSSGSFGAGGSASVSLGTPRFPAQPVPSAPFGNSAFPDSNPAYSNFPTYGAAIDPTFGPNGEYAPRFNNKR